MTCPDFRKMCLKVTTYYCIPLGYPKVELNYIVVFSRERRVLEEDRMSIWRNFSKTKGLKICLHNDLSFIRGRCIRTRQLGYTWNLRGKVSIWLSLSLLKVEIILNLWFYKREWWESEFLWTNTSGDLRKLNSRSGEYEKREDLDVTVIHIPSAVNKQIFLQI